MEKWAEYKDGYFVSTLGNVKYNNKIIKPYESGNYKHIKIDGKRKTCAGYHWRFV